MTATTIRVQMAQRKDTAANWTAANPILLSGEIGYETDSKKFKIGDGGSNWNTLAYLPIPDGSGNLTITGNLEIGTTGSLTFEGSTADGFETTLAVTDPTADRTITFPDRSGTVITSGDTGTVTSTMLADGTIVNADISATAEIAVSKLANGTANQVLVTDGTDVSWSDNLTLAGNLTVNGTTTTIDTETLLVEDKNIEMGVVATPTDVTADGGGITLRGTTDKTINWIDSTDSWTSSEHVDLASGKSYRINNTEVLSSTTLGSGVTGSSLTSVGTIGTGVWQGTAIDAVYLDSTVVTTGDTGTVTSTMIADGTIVDADVNASAAIAGTKISPDFGSQNVTTTGTSTAASFIPTSSTVPTNGLYLSASNSVALSTNGQGHLFIDSSGNIGVGTSSLTSGAGRTYLTLGGTNLGSIALKNASNTEVLYIQTGSASVDHYMSVAGYQAFWTNNTERLRITSAGLVGIGTGSPGTLVEGRITGAGGTPATSGTSQPNAVFRVSGSDTTGVLDIGCNSGAPWIQSTDRTNLSQKYNLLLNPNGGSVGIGTASASEALHVVSATDNQGALIENSTSRASLTVKSAATTSSSYVNFGNPNGSSRAFFDYRESLNRLLISTSTTSGELVFATGSQSERFRCDSSGRLLVGTSTTGGISGARFQVAQTSNYCGEFTQYSNDAFGSYFFISKSRGTLGNQGLVQSGDEIGVIGFSASNGTTYTTAALIQVAVDGTPGANDMPGRLVFSTTSGASASPTERLRITSAGVLQVADAGNIAVGTTTGTKIGTATTQKLGFFNATPVVQPAAVADATDAATVITQLNDLLAKLRTLGIIAT